MCIRSLPTGYGSSQVSRALRQNQNIIGLKTRSQTQEIYVFVGSNSQKEDKSRANTREASLSLFLYMSFIINNIFIIGPLLKVKTSALVLCINVLLHHPSEKCPKIQSLLTNVDVGQTFCDFCS